VVWDATASNHRAIFVTNISKNIARPVIYFSDDFVYSSAAGRRCLVTANKSAAYSVAEQSANCEDSSMALRRRSICYWRRRKKLSNSSASNSRMWEKNYGQLKTRPLIFSSLLCQRSACTELNKWWMQLLNITRLITESHFCRRLLCQGHFCILSFTFPQCRPDVLDADNFVGRIICFRGFFAGVLVNKKPACCRKH